jgi:endonuclease YncB( thermonuclease family)
MPLRALALRSVFALWLALLAWAVAAPAAAETLRGVVIVVVDGDTVLFKPDHYHPSGRAFLKIRLADIDAPEKDQPYGDAATRALSARVLNRRVEVETVAIDVYGRTIARIRIGGEEVGEDLVQRGYAWAAARSRRASVLRIAQRQARLSQRGLWQDAAPTPPWTWRRAHPAPRR